MKTTILKSSASLTLTAILAAGLTGCGENESTDEATSSSSASPELNALFLDAEPQGAISVAEARTKLQPGTEVTVTGRIAGALKPFTEGFASLVLADDSLETCDLIPGDLCETPWDACCEEPETIKALRLSVQVPGEGGTPVEQSLKGVNGLKELDPIIVIGKVAEGSTQENLIIDATGIYRKPS